VSRSNRPSPKATLYFGTIFVCAVVATSWVMVRYLVYSESVVVPATINSHLSIIPAAPAPSPERRMPEILRVSGSVTDANSGTPITSFRTIEGRIIDDEKHIFWLAGYRRISVHPGKYNFVEQNISPGYVVRVEAAGYYPVVSRIFGQGETNTTWNFKLKRGPDLLVRAIDPDGKPAASAAAHVVIPGDSAGIDDGKFMILNGQPAFQFKADAAGRIALWPQTPPFVVAVIDDQGMAIADQDDLASSNVIHLQAWGRINGRLMIGKDPWPKQFIRARSSERRKFIAPFVFFSHVAQTQPDGTFTIAKAAPIPLEICRTLNWHNTAAVGQDMLITSQQRYFDLIPGQTINIILGGTGQPVIGKVQIPPSFVGRRDWSFMPACAIAPRNAPNSLWSPEARYTVQFEPDGSFRVEDVPPGDYFLYIDIGTGDFAQTRLAWSATPVLIPPIPSGRTDQPLDLGLIKMKMQ
jgi:hypothetical protein